MTRIARPNLRRLAGNDGQALVSGLMLLAGVLIPLLFLVPLFARIEQGRLSAEQAARAAVRAAAEAPNSAAAQVAANDALDQAQTQTGARLEIALEGQFARDSLLRATVSAHISVVSLPLYGRFGTITVHSRASAPVDRYRSLLPETP